MKLSEHAKNKLEVYAIEGDKIIFACRKPTHELYDTEEQTQIKIIKLEEVIFAVVINIQNQTIVTVYRTDIKTVTNRQIAKRWI